MLQVVLTLNQPLQQFVVSPMSDCVHSVVAVGVLLLPVSLFLCFSVSCCDVAAVCLCASR